nr:retrovirus-related Pol polyprotein from transposon TNT 1-94 [Tanacetum cinerariifolium]
MEAIRFNNTLVDQIEIDDSSRCHPDEFLYEDDPSRQYQVDSNISYYVIPQGRSLTKLTQENYVPEVIVLNEHDVPLTEDIRDPPNLINTEGTHEQNVQDDQKITQPTDVPSGDNTEASRPITEPLIPDVPQSHISNQASTSSYPVPQDRWSRDQHIEHVNITGNPGEGMLTRSMAAKLTAASAKIAIGCKWVCKNKKDEHGTTTKNKARLVAQGHSQEEGIDYDETFVPVARMEAVRIFLAFATYMNFKVYQMDVKSAFLNGKMKEEVYVIQPHGFESSDFPDYVCKLDKALYGLKQTPRAWYLKGTPTLGLYYPKCSSFNLKSAKKQQSLAMSSVEAEYIAAIGYCASILWMKSQLSDYDIHYKMVPIFYDNTSAIAISNNPVLYSRTKHIDIRYHFIRDHILKGDIKLHFIPTEY